MQKALLLIEYLAEQKAEQLKTGVMMVVEGVEIDLRGMEWFLENPEGMLGMRHFMKKFEEEHKYGVVKLVVAHKQHLRRLGAKMTAYKQCLHRREASLSRE